MTATIALSQSGESGIREGAVEVFRNATMLINQKLTRDLMAMKGFGGMGRSDARTTDRARPAGEVTFHEKIGAHDVSVVRVLDTRRFIAWVEDYLKKAGVDNPLIPPPLKLVVKEYLRDGFEWFAFNVVELGTETVTKEAV
ncbi:MAG: hypothetical protein JXB62_17685 [Pirellulales bacterium]|nr:hypothetical protein [Pirellulales bacterium]